MSLGWENPCNCCLSQFHHTMGGGERCSGCVFNVKHKINNGCKQEECIGFQGGECIFDFEDRCHLRPGAEPISNDVKWENGRYIDD